MNCCCENCGWSEIIGSPIMCNYSGHRTWRDECCEAWKPKNETDEKDMIKVVRCKDCKYYSGQFCNKNDIYPWPFDDWFCADGEGR